MKTQTAAEKLEMLEAALDHLFETSVDEVLREYQDYLDKKQEEETAPPAAPVDRETALAYFAAIPEKCRNNEALDTKEEMLKAVSEEDLLTLGQEQAATHPDLAKEILSMIEFSIRFKRLL